MDEIWNDAFTGFTRTAVIKCAESEKRDRMGSIGYCKVCKCKVKLSNNYTGEFPLCFSHRNPNDRTKKNQKPKRLLVVSDAESNNSTP